MQEETLSETGGAPTLSGGAGLSGRDKIADWLAWSADALHEQAPRTMGQTGEAVWPVTKKMKDAAAYIRSHDAESALGDMEGLIRRQPGRSLLVAAVIGFAIGSLLSKDQDA